MQIRLTLFSLNNRLRSEFNLFYKEKIILIFFSKRNSSSIVNERLSLEVLIFNPRNRSNSNTSTIDKWPNHLEKTSALWSFFFQTENKNKKRISIGNHQSKRNKENGVEIYLDSSRFCFDIDFLIDWKSFFNKKRSLTMIFEPYASICWFNTFKNRNEKREMRCRKSLRENNIFQLLKRIN